MVGNFGGLVLEGEDRALGNPIHNNLDLDIQHDRLALWDY